MDYRNLNDWRRMDADCTFAMFAALEREKNAEIERLTARVSELIKQSARLARGSNCDKAELLDEIIHLRDVISAYSNIMAAYRLSRQPPESSLDVVRKYWAKVGGDA